jgi:nicotinamide mononucleotide transporter
MTSEALSFSDALAGAWAAQSPWEMLAVGLALAYLLLAVRQNPLCWLAAGVSTAIYTALFWQVQLVMQSALNAYYLAMAVYGWWLWRRGGEEHTPLPINRWSWSRHALALLVVLVLTALSGSLLGWHSDAAWPYLDSLITWGAVITTFMVARKVLENWAWWMLINSLAVFLFLERGLVLTAVLHGAYLLISIFGWRRWWLDYRRQSPAAAPLS